MATRKIGNININYTVPEAQTQIYNALGRDAGQDAYVQGEANPNFFQKRWNSIKNAFGSTGAALASAIKDSSQNTETDLMLKGNQGRMQDIVKKYGYNSLDDYYNALDDAEVNDKAKYNELLNTVQAELKNQSAANMEAMKKNQADYKDWVDNNYVSNQLKQDRGKFAGSAINTLSTAVDLTGLSATPIANSIQGGIEGVADELEQNGFENFDSKRAGQNAIIGATTGLVTGALNKGISNKLINPQTGNLKMLNGLASKGNLGKIGATVATGVGRGAISGAVGGATGAGLSAAMNNGDVIQSALQGAKQGAISGATTGGIMAGANMAISKTPGIGKFYNELQGVKQKWEQSGDGDTWLERHRNRRNNTLNSGESGVGNWLNRKTTSRALNSMGNLGNSIRNMSYSSDGKNNIANWKEIDDPIYLDEKIVIDEQGNIGKVSNKGNASRAATAYEVRDNRLKPLDFAVEGDAEYYKNYLTKELGISGEEYDSRLVNNQTPTTAKFSQEAFQNGDDSRNNLIKAINKYNESMPIEERRIMKLSNDGTTLTMAGTKQKVPVEDMLETIGYKDDTPTTAKGWLKRAGERIVEDANDRGVGLGIKDVNQDMPDDVRNMKINNWDDNGDTTYGITSDPRVRQQLIASIEAQLAENPKARVGDTNFDADAIISEFSDKLTPEQYKAFNPADAENALVQEIQSLEANRGFAQPNTPAQDAYAKGRGSFSDALNEFIEQGGNIVRDANGKLSLVTPNNTPTQAVQGDAWDRLAQQSGYNSYDDVIAAYRQANPNVKLNQNGAAGQILSWLDENPNTPTTAGEWAKRAGQRIVEDANNRGVGLGIRDVSQESPETEIYRRLTGQNATTEEALPEVFEPEARNQIEKRNKFQSIGEQLINTSKQQKYRALYDALDGKTATRAVETNAPETLAEMGIKPENYLEAAKTSNYINQVVSDLAKDSNVKVNIPDMPNRLISAADDVAFDGVDAPNKFNRAIQQVIADGTSPDEYTAGYLLEKSRDFGNKAASVKGTSNDSKALRTAYTNAKYILRDEAANALANANITGNETNANIAQGLSKMGANQKVIDYYTAPIDGEAPTAKDYIRRSSLFEQARDMGTQVKAEQLTRSASKQPTNWATRLWRASGLDQPVELLLNNTIAPLASTVTKYSGKAIKGIGDAAANVATPINNSNSATINTNYNPATNIYNAIARTEGLTNGEQARTANYLVNAAQEAEVVPNTSANSLEALVSPTTTSTTSVYDSIYGSPVATTTAMQESPKTGYFQTTGDYWTDLLASAMSSAIDDNNATAFASLYAMYQDALSNLQKQNSTSSEQKLTATQQRANAAMNSLERLAGMTPDLGYNLSNIPVVGDIATFGGNDYESEAKSLAQQIGYMVSGSNIKDNEAEAIGKAYVPQPFDNEQTRQNKLRRAYEIISQYQNGYAS